VPGYSTEYGELAPREQWTWLGDLSGVFGARYLVAAAKDVKPELVLARDGTAVVVELPHALPRAYLATGVQRFKRVLVPAYLRSSEFQPGREVVLEGEGERVAPGEPLRADVHRQGDTVEVSTTATGPAVLVLNETLFAGVQAFEGETELPVLRANHVVRGVALGAGTHTVRFTFQTPGLIPGALLSVFALVLGVFVARRR
jgi:hypothetical protein